MQEQNTKMAQKEKDRFAQAENILKQHGLNNFEKIEARNEAWILFHQNETYYRNSFKRKMKAENINQSGEDEFATCFFDTINSVFNNFDLEKGKLEHFFNKQWFYRAKDKIDEMKKRGNMEYSLDEDIDSDKKEEKSINKREKNKEDETAFEKYKEIEDDNKITEILVELLNAITHLNEHRAKTSRKTYFKMFYTDYITEHCKNYEIGKAMKNKEKSIFAGLHTDFLDFYMREICRTFYRIQKVPLKNMSEIKENGKQEEIKIPLPNQVYTIYLGLSAAGNITQMRNKYKEFCEQLEIKNKLKE